MSSEAIGSFASGSWDHGGLPPRSRAASATRPKGSNGPTGPGGPDGPIDQREREGGVATKSRSKTARPKRYKVLLYNDDYTPMEFVVALLEQQFGKSPAAATQIMLAIHRSGLGVAGVFVQEIAETKVAAVHGAAEERGYPLRAGLEKE
jgi:ATP-dependent Clp protease adaptor protein ClpS